MAGGISSAVTPPAINVIGGGCTSIMCLPTPTATPTPPGPYYTYWTPTPYPRPWYIPATPGAPTATPTPSPTPTLQPGQINWRALAVEGEWELLGKSLLVNMGVKPTIRAAGRTVAILPPIGTGIALLASVGPNLYTNIVVEHAPARTVILQATTDAIGVPASAGGALLLTLVATGAGPDPSDLGWPFVGGLVISAVYDVFGAPPVYRWLDQKAASFGF